MGKKGSRRVEKREISILEGLELLYSTDKPKRLILSLSNGNSSRKFRYRRRRKVLKESEDFWNGIGRGMEISIGYFNIKRGTYEVFDKMGFKVHEFFYEGIEDLESGKKYNYKLTYFTR